MVNEKNKGDVEAQIKELEILSKIAKLKCEIVENDYKRLLYLKMLSNDTNSENNKSGEKVKD